MPKLTVRQLALAGQRVFLRADLNVPLDGGAVADDTRLTAVIPTIRHCLDAGASVLLASHLGRPKGKRDDKFSLAPVAKRLSDVLAAPVPLAPDCVGDATLAQARATRPGEVLLLENLRFHAGEEANDAEFARTLAAPATCYVDDAFAAAHRAHASIVAITRFLRPAAAGLLLERELDSLGRILERPERPLVAILGGAKVSDKLALVRHLIGRVDALVIGGGMAFTFLNAQGHEIGRSLFEPDMADTAREVLEEARRAGRRIALPVDTVVATGVDAAEGRAVPVSGIPPDLMGLDIGPRSVDEFTAVVHGASTIVWNGPMGVFEKAPFAAGTLALARAVAGARAFTVVGGGDTVAAVQRAGVAERIGYISTAGGAFLEFLEGRRLPGVEALTDA